MEFGKNLDYSKCIQCQLGLPLKGTRLCDICTYLLMLRMQEEAQNPTREV